MISSQKYALSTSYQAERISTVTPVFGEFQRVGSKWVVENAVNRTAFHAAGFSICENWKNLGPHHVGDRLYFGELDPESLETNIEATCENT